MYIKTKFFLFIIAGFITLALYKTRQHADTEEALQSCLESVQKKCGPVIDYASSLEIQNSILNKKLNKCRSK